MIKLAAAPGFPRAKRTVPAPPAASCGLIDAAHETGRKCNRARTDFRYGPLGYLFVETVSDDSADVEHIVTKTLFTITVQETAS